MSPEEKPPLLVALERMVKTQADMLAESKVQSKYLRAVYVAIVTVCFLVILAFCYGLACGMM
jgi:hypothetical protein